MRQVVGRLFPDMLAAIVALVLLAPAQAAAAGLFGTVETASSDFTPFPKWTDVLKRVLDEKGAKEGGCASKDFNSCHYNRWKTFIDSVRGMPKDQQIAEVNRFMNASRYIVDPINWGISDYWATPGQFFDKNGDCEDYAIAKYMTLRALDWPAGLMRVVIVQDLNLSVAHAVLTVHHNGKNLILDNQIAIVVEDRRIAHYRPIYSLNEDGWWRHRAN